MFGPGDKTDNFASHYFAFSTSRRLPRGAPPLQPRGVRRSSAPSSGRTIVAHEPKARDDRLHRGQIAARDLTANIFDRGDQAYFLKAVAQQTRPQGGSRGEGRSSWRRAAVARMPTRRRQAWRQAEPVMARASERSRRKRGGDQREPHDGDSCGL